MFEDEFACSDEAQTLQVSMVESSGVRFFLKYFMGIVRKNIATERHDRYIYHLGDIQV